MVEQFTWKALSIRQPWAWLIANGYKDIENRDWPTKFRGEFLIHASSGMTQDEYYDCCDFLKAEIPDIAKIIREQHRHLQNGFSWKYLKENFTGGIIGKAEIVDCVETSTSPWFFGKHGFVIKNATPMPIIPCKGALGFFYPDLTKVQNQTSAKQMAIDFAEGVA